MAFVLFLKLPVEIQNKIWKIAANQEEQSLVIKRAQIPDIAWRPSVPFPAHLMEEHYIILYSKGVPAILQASQRARMEAARHYQLMFSGVNGRALWFNPATDSLEVRRRFLEHYPDRPGDVELRDADSVTKDLAKVKSLTEYQDPLARPGLASSVARFRSFYDLEFLLIVDWRQRANNRLRTLPDTIPAFWDATMNPKRVTDGKQPNPAPSVEFAISKLDGDFEW